MKTIANILISHLAFLAFFGGVAYAFAQEQEAPRMTPPPQNELSTERADEKAERVADRQAVQEGKRTVLNERTQERIINLAANMSNRIEATTARLQNISNRLVSRIEKMEGSEVDTDTAIAALASAQISLDAASAAMENIDTEVTQAVGSEDMRSTWFTVKNTYVTATNHLKTAHSEIVASVAALKSPRAIERNLNTAPDTSTPDEEALVE
jgi:hypothetical protein